MELVGGEDGCVGAGSTSCFPQISTECGAHFLYRVSQCKGGYNLYKRSAFWLHSEAGIVKQVKELKLRAYAQKVARNDAKIKAEVLRFTPP
jgi:hypothetical protein